MFSLSHSKRNCRNRKGESDRHTTGRKNGVKALKQEPLYLFVIKYSTDIQQLWMVS